MFVASCFVCQKSNSSTKQILGLRAWKGSFAFSTVGIGFFGPLPPSAGNQYIPLIGDHFIKWNEANALPDQSAPTTAEAPLVDHWITCFGCLENLHSDQRRNFEANFVANLTKELQSAKTRTTAFHPQSNAVIERTNGTLLNMLPKTTYKNNRNWSEPLLCVLLTYQTSVHESAGYTAYILFFGHEATPPIDLQFPPPCDANWTNYHDYVAEARLRFHAAYDQAHHYLKGQQKRQQALYNAKVDGPKYTVHTKLHGPYNSFGAVHTKLHKSSVI